MKKKILNYVIVRFRPCPVREEFINIGTLGYTEEGKVVFNLAHKFDTYHKAEVLWDTKAALVVKVLLDTLEDEYLSLNLFIKTVADFKRYVEPTEYIVTFSKIRVKSYDNLAQALSTIMRNNVEHV